MLLGATPNPYPYIKDADIYVQTSRHEGYCLTLAEAKSLFKPIITTNFSGAKEQIMNGYNGMIIECNEDSLYKAVKELIDKPELRNKFSANLMNNSESLIERTEKKSIL